MMIGSLQHRKRERERERERESAKRLCVDAFDQI